MLRAGEEYINKIQRYYVYKAKGRHERQLITEKRLLNQSIYFIVNIRNVILYIALSIILKELTHAGTTSYLTPSILLIFHIT